MPSPPPDTRGEPDGSGLSGVGVDATEVAPSQPAPRGLSTLDSTSMGSVSASAELERSLEREQPTRISRYAILQRLGAGGMGVVFAAYDTELDRKVAIKLIRPERREGTHSESRGSKMLREAKALAKLSHPNVVQVYDVGRHRDEVYIAMEFVHGQTMRAWLRAAERSWREVVKVMLPAGRGIAAAHDAGLIHRDFKPANVIVREDGGVKVLDFGLARREGLSKPRSSVSDDPEATKQEEETDGFAGTPAYMAPEQITGGQVDGRCDQFAFCVVLHEAVYGDRPEMGFLKEDAAGKPENVDRAPGWLWELIARGLDPNPVNRFGSMHELLRELTRDRQRVRNRVLMIGGALAALVGAGYLGVLADSGPEVELCVGAADEVARVWSPERREAMKLAFESTGLAHATMSYEKAAAALDDYTAAWVDTHEEACMASHRGEQSESMLDRRMRCLDNRLAEVDATVDLLVDATADVVNEEIDLERALPDLAFCSDREALEAEVLPPEDPALRARAQALAEGGIEIAALDRTGQLPEARSLAEKLHAEAKELGVAATLAERAFDLGSLQRRSSQYEDAHRTLEDAYVHSIESGHDRILMDSSLVLYRMHGADLGDEQGPLWGRIAAAAVEHRGNPRDARTRLLRIDASIEGREARHENALQILEQAVALYADDPEFRRSNMAALLYVEMAGQHSAMGRYPKARELILEALAIREARLGKNHPSLAPVLLELAGVQDRAGEYQESLATNRRALGLVETKLGPHHRQVATILNSEAATLTQLGRYDEAAKNYERALAVLESIMPADHVDFAPILVNLASALMEEERYEEAMALNERALKIMIKARGERHPAVGTIRNNMGSIRELEGDYEAALELYSGAYELWVESLGEDSPNVPIALYNLATTNHRLGRDRKAEQYVREAIEKQVALTDAEHPKVGLFRMTLGEALAGQGKTKAALVELEEGLRISAQEPGITPERLSEERFALAKVLHSSGTDEARALELARLAADGYREGRKHEHQAEVEAWLAKRR